jgi:uncharacterized protein (TIGR03435 family)
MSALFAEMNQMAATGLAALLNTLWYAAAVVSLTWVALRFMRRVNAATRYWIWTAVLGFLVVLPFLPALVSRLETAGSAPAAVAPLATVPAAPQAVQHLAPVTITLDSTPGPNHWPLYLLALWMLIAGWQLFLLLRGVVSVRRMKGRAEAVPGAALPIELCRRAEVLASDETNSPVAVGYIHPAVILPPELPASLEKGEMQDVLLHELAHLMRFDDWLNLASRALGAILVLHPLAAIVLRQIEREREMACDDFVVAHTGSARSYARSLARLHDLRTSAGTRLLAPALLGGKVSLADRIESLLHRGREFSARPSVANLGVGALLLAVLLGAGGLIPGWIAIAQTTPPESLAEMQQSACAHLPKSFCAGLPTTFEVASIKPAKPDDPNITVRWPPGRFIAINDPIVNLIHMAYHLRPEQLEGLPSWAKSRRYTIQAEALPGIAKAMKIAHNLPARQRDAALEVIWQSNLQMLRSLLADRFKLRVHRTNKQSSVYEIVIAKGGPKLKPFKKAELGAGHDSGVTSRRGVNEFVGVSLPYFAYFLSKYVGRTVIDRTGLSGRYDFTLRWNRMAGRFRMGFHSKPGIPPKVDSAGPSIFIAMKEQLGLKLKPAKGPVQVLVVDHIEPPTPN